MAPIRVEAQGMMLTALADVARNAGLIVHEVDGWKTRGHGQMVAVETITCHHTGGLNDLNTIVKGRDLGLPSELAGPLAHFFLARDGSVYVVAAGLSYHAGVSLKTAYTNSHAVGIEAEAVGIPGTAGDWPDVQMAAYARLAKALQVHYGLSNADVRGHKETCSPVGRKTDPDFSMVTFRASVADVDLSTPFDPSGDIMSWDLSDQHTLTAADAAAYGGTTRAGDKKSWNEIIRFSPAVARLRRETDADVTELKAQLAASAKTSAALTAQLSTLASSVTALTAQVSAVSAAVAKLAAGGSVDAATLAAAAKSGAEVALSETTISFTVKPK
jgi:hypothetical protein